MNQEVKNKKILFADLDGTLIETISGEVFPKGIWDMKFRFDVLDAIKKLNPEYILIASNQGGIESGFVNVLNLYITLADPKSYNSFKFKRSYKGLSLSSMSKKPSRWKSLGL